MLEGQDNVVDESGVIRPWYEYRTSIAHEVQNLAPSTPESALPPEWRALARDLEDGPTYEAADEAFPMTKVMGQALSSLDETPAMLLLLLAIGESLSDAASDVGLSPSQARTTRRTAHRDLLAVFDATWPAFEAWLAEGSVHHLRVVRFSEASAGLGRLGSLEPEVAMRAFADLGTSRHHKLRLLPLGNERFLLFDGSRDARKQVESLLRECGTLVPIPAAAKATGFGAFVLTHATEAFDGVRRTRGGSLYSAHLSKTQIAHLLVRELAARGYRRWNARALLCLMRHFAPHRVGDWSRAALERALERLGTDIVHPTGNGGEWACSLSLGSPSPKKMVPVAPPPSTNVLADDDVPTASRAVDDRAPPVVSPMHPPTPTTANRISRSVDTNLADRVRNLLVKRSTSMTYIELARELATTPRAIRRVFQSTLIPCGAVATDDGRRWRLANGAAHDSERTTT